MVTIKDLLEQRGYWKKEAWVRANPALLFDEYHDHYPLDREPPAPEPKSWGLCLKGNGRPAGTKLLYNGKMVGACYRVEFVQDVAELGKLKLWAHASEIDLTNFEGCTELTIAGTSEAIKEAAVAK